MKTESTFVPATGKPRTPIRWGLSSTGRMADWFASDFAFAEGGEIVAVASRSQESARNFADRHGISKAYGSYADMLQDDGIDLIYVCSPHSHHLEHARSALRAGKAVVCEKPLTTTPEECAELARLAEETGIYLMEAMWTFFLPAIRKAREWLEEGRIGALRHVQASFGYPQDYDPRARVYDPVLAGGALLEMGVYPVALAWYFLRRDPQSWQVTARTAPTGVDDDLVAVADYGDCTATLSTSFRCKLPNWAYIVGEQGHIAIPDFWRARQCLLYELDTQVDSFEDSREHQGFAFEASAANADLLAGRRQSEIVPLAASAAIQQHMESIRQHF